MSDVSLGALPRYSLVVGEAVKKPTNQPNLDSLIFLLIILSVWLIPYSTQANTVEVIAIYKFEA